MLFLVSLMLPFVVCIALVGVTAMSSWSRLSAPWAYVAFSFLGVLGLHRCLQVISVFVKGFFDTGGYFLEYEKKSNLVEMALSSITVEAFIISTVLAISGWYLLDWMKTVMIR